MAEEAKQTTDHFVRPVKDYLPDLKERHRQLIEKQRNATAAAIRLLGFFRKSEADDPEIFITGVAATLSRYSDDVINWVTGFDGIASQQTFLPSIAEIRKACDAREAEEVRRIEREQQLQRQLTERREWEKQKKREYRPIYEELKAEYGEQWGLAAAEQSEATQRMRDYLDRANKQMFERACREAGLPTDSLVSPFLLATLRKDAE